MNIKDTRLRNFRRVLEEKNLKLKDISNLLDKAPSQVSAFGGKNPTKGIGDQIAREIERVLELHGGYLDLPFILDEFNQLDVLRVGSRRLPVLTSTGAAAWCKNSTGVPGTASEWIDAPGPTGSGAFALIVEGVSMEPVFVEGDKVVIDPAAPVLSGSFVAVRRADNAAVFLRQFRSEGNEEYLHAANPNWPDRIVKLSEDWKLCGRAKWKITEL